MISLTEHLAVSVSVIKLGLRACGAKVDVPRSVAVKNRYLEKLSLLGLYIENSSSMFVRA